MELSHNSLYYLYHFILAEEVFFQLDLNFRAAFKCSFFIPVCLTESTFAQLNAAYDERVVSLLTGKPHHQL